MSDVDIARRWVGLLVKGGKERSVPIDTDVAGALQTYLLAERPETDADALFVVANGAHRGRPLSPAGLRTVSVFTASGPVSLPGIHTPYGIRSALALAEAGVDLSVIQALMGTTGSKF